MSFVKLDCGIVDSSLWVERDTRSIFITALVMAEPYELTEPTPQIEVHTLANTGWTVPAGWYGFVPAAGPGIVRRDGCDMEIGLKSLEELGAPDPHSRAQDFEGRRLVRVDGGYIVLNYFKHRDRDHTAADRMRRLRARKKEARISANGKHVTENRSNVTANVTAEQPPNRNELRNVTQAESRVQSAEGIGTTKRLPTARKKPRADSTAFAFGPLIDAFTEAFPGSIVPTSKWALAFKTLVAKHGPEETLRRWKVCIAKNPNYATPHELGLRWAKYDDAASGMRMLREDIQDIIKGEIMLRNQERNDLESALYIAGRGGAMPPQEWIAEKEAYIAEKDASIAKHQAML